jgi:CRISPR/Cas system CSM-associated protein Csm4 (group 5 of RAMP superfamily)
MVKAHMSFVDQQRFQDLVSTEADLREELNAYKGSRTTAAYQSLKSLHETAYEEISLYARQVNERLVAQVAAQTEEA